MDFSEDFVDLIIIVHEDILRLLLINYVRYHSLLILILDTKFMML